MKAKLIFVLFMVQALVFLPHDILAKKTSCNLNVKLDRLAQLMRTHKSYLAFPKYIEILKKHPAQSVVNTIAEATGEVHYTMRLKGYNIVAKPVWGANDKFIYYVRDPGRSEMLCKLELQTGKEYILAKDLGNWQIRSISIVDEQHISLIIYNSWARPNYFKIPSISTVQRLPLKKKQIEKMLIAYRKGQYWRGLYPGDEQITIFSDHGKLKIWENDEFTELSVGKFYLANKSGWEKSRFVYCLSPCFSPDGTKIAFILNTRSPSYNTSCYGTPIIADFDGKNARPLAREFWATEPSFSPDGTKIVFTRTVWEDDQELIVWGYIHYPSAIAMVDTDGKNYKILTKDRHYEYKDPSLDHSNKRLVYLAAIGGIANRTYIMNLMYLNKYYTADDLLRRFERVEIRQRAIFDLMRDIRAAQDKYKKKNRRYAKNLKELVTSGYLPACVKNPFYGFRIKLKGALFTYTVNISPIDFKKSGKFGFKFNQSYEYPERIYLGSKFAGRVDWRSALPTPPPEMQTY